MSAAAEMREALARVRALCDKAERSEGIVIWPGHSEFKTVDLGLLRHAISFDCTCDWFPLSGGDVKWDDDCPAAPQARAS